MSDFTYELPFSNKKLLFGILNELKRKNESDLHIFLKNSNLSIEELGTSYYVDFSRDSRWNAIGINIKFSVNPNLLENLDTPSNKNIIRTISSNLIPTLAGFDLKEIVFAPDLTIDFDDDDDILSEFVSQVDDSSNSVLKEILPEDIKQKGLYMSEIYTYLYLVENSLRIFIENVAKESFGDDYFLKINIPTSLRNTISSRKDKEEKLKWISIRGNSNLFYLDFKDIGTLISNNWNLFNQYFPSQDYILPKLVEMAECRNLIAHNSFIDKNERDLIKVYYRSILKQIEKKL